jgi:hypothetical protein
MTNFRIGTLASGGSDRDTLDQPTSRTSER